MIDKNAVGKPAAFFEVSYIRRKLIFTGHMEPCSYRKVKGYCI